MDSFFFRVEHDLLRSEAFKSLGGSAIKVYLVIGLYSDFGTGWAYPSIRTIAKQGGMSRQTVLDAIAELANNGLLVTRKTPGKATAYRVLRHHAPEPPPGPKKKPSRNVAESVPESWGVGLQAVPKSLEAERSGVLESSEVVARFLGLGGPVDGPKREPAPREEDSISIPIPGTPFRLTAEGRLLVAVDVQDLLTGEGVPARLAQRIARQRPAEDVAKVVLNALYLRSQGKLQNGPGYIRAAIEDGYELLPQVANRLEARRRELQESVRAATARAAEECRRREREAEESAARMLIEGLRADDLERLVQRAVSELPEPITRRNPTLSNPFVRARVYELAGGDPGE